MTRQDDGLDIVVSRAHEGESWDGAVRATLPHVARWEATSRARLVVVQNRRDQYGGAIDKLAKARTVVTPRSRSGAARGPALAYAPTVETLQMAHSIASTGLAVVAGHEPWINAWCRALGATDLATRDPFPPFEERQRTELGRLSWYGNNGWPPRDSFIRTPVRSALLELIASGLTMDDIAGAMYARQHTRDAVARLPRFL